MTLPIENCDYFLRMIDLPDGIFAMLVSNGDGTTSLYLDPRRSWEQQLDDYEHELWHIVRDDLYTDKPIQVVEGIP